MESKEATAALREKGFSINENRVRVERLWRSVKYEEVYLNDYANARQAHCGLDSYFKPPSEGRAFEIEK